MKKTQLLRVSRRAHNSLNPYTIYTMTLAEAITSRAWDSCNGTMDAHVSIAHPDDDDSTSYGEQVFLIDGVACAWREGRYVKL